MLFVYAAGNSGIFAAKNDYNYKNWPAAFAAELDGVVSVASIGPSGNVSYFSNTG